jgi:DNA invertase Pin-like site-specific DNA recombinase
MNKICIIYCTSTDGGVERLTDLAHGQGFSIAKTLTDSSATRPGQGAGWQALCRDVTKRASQMVIVPSIAVLGAGLDDLVTFLGGLVAGNMDLVAVNDGIDTTTPEGLAWMAAVASLQDYKKAVRRQTARAGQFRAREAGIHCGRPALPAATIEKARLLILSGHGIRPTARSLGISPARVAAEKAAMRNAGNFL